MNDQVCQLGKEVDRIFPKFLLGVMAVILVIPFVFVFVIVANVYFSDDSATKAEQCLKYGAEGWDKVFNVCYKTGEDGYRKAIKFE